MEEPPKIERIISTQGVSLSDTATILKTYVSNIDQYHHHPDVQPLVDNDDNEHAITSQEEQASSNDHDKKAETPRKSRQEREEEALIAQMDQLVNNKSSAGMISDDVYERLKMITKSICAEVDGKPLSVCGVTAVSSRGDSGKSAELGEEEQNDEADGFLALEDGLRLEREEQEQQQQPQEDTPKQDKKEEKKAKKSAKKEEKSAKKAAKRKAKETEDTSGQKTKRAKVSS
mmetsp:Transcript_37785/g.61745  ORF Transcript_37785/g.61745 Transcript_37785/m.61745 type:complete len:231 (+) Transcript_37785:221-913(+)